MIRVLVADDHAVVRRGLVQILEEVPTLDGGGLEVLHQLESFKPDLPVLILSMYSEKQYALRALKAGAAGYLTKESAPDELIAAIQTVARGEKYVSRSVGEALADALGRETEKESHETLSDREYQVMCLLAAGKTVTDIATELSLSVKTVSTYRARLMDKLRLKSTAEIIRYALERGLVQ